MSEHLNFGQNTSSVPGNLRELLAESSASLALTNRWCISYDDIGTQSYRPADDLKRCVSDRIVTPFVTIIAPFVSQRTLAVSVLSLENPY